jgi:hypothetical protein
MGVSFFSILNLHSQNTANHCKKGQGMPKAKSQTNQWVDPSSRITRRSSRKRKRKSNGAGLDQRSMRWRHLVFHPQHFYILSGTVNSEFSEVYKKGAGRAESSK